MPETTESGAQPVPQGFCVVLCQPRNPLNIGAAARAMSNFGFLDLRLVSPYEVAFREARSAVGAGGVLEAAQVASRLEEVLADCTLVVGTTSLGARKPRHVVRRLDEAAAALRGEAARGKVALLFGSEKFGLSNEELSHCHWLLRIPTREEHSSMNLGQAVAVCLYELVRDPVATAPDSLPAPPATGAQLQLLEERLWEALELCGWVNPRVAQSQRQKMHRLIKRAHFSRRDAEVWLGIWRQILWKLRPGAAATERDSQS